MISDHEWIRAFNEAPIGTILWAALLVIILSWDPPPPRSP